MAALLAALLFAADAVLVSLIQQPDLYLDVLADGCAVLAWLVHLSSIVVLQRSVFRRSRGPPLQLVLVLLSVPNAVVTLVGYSHLQDYRSVSEPLKLSRLALASARTLPILVYLLAFAFPCLGDAGYTLHVNAADGSPLLSEVGRPQTGEMVAEDGSGRLSRLFYLWLNPLLKRGQMGALDKATDVYHLPRSLRTSAVCQNFRRRWDSCRRGDPGNEGGERGSAPVRRNLPSSHQEADVSLWKALHETFGPGYYALGLLKVLVSVLSLAGPVLLSSLVNFTEEKGAPAGTGVCCALGLFLTTLLSSFFRNVFVFEVSKVELRARAALVSAIYGKALQASGSSLAAFALGQVVNLMSTDANRAAAFYSNFHELWSMPFCFLVTLYLLYLQVGVAFLGGLGVALLLIPFNKFLASRILSNNKQMLKSKDGRVKVGRRL